MTNKPLKPKKPRPPKTDTTKPRKIRVVIGRPGGSNRLAGLVTPYRAQINDFETRIRKRFSGNAAG